MKYQMKILSLFAFALMMTTVAFSQKGLNSKRGGISGDPQSKQTKGSSNVDRSKVGLKTLPCKMEDLQKHFEGYEAVTLFDAGTKKSEEVFIRKDGKGNLIFKSQKALSKSNDAVKRTAVLGSKKEKKLELKTKRQRDGTTAFSDAKGKTIGNFMVSKSKNGVTTITCK